MPWRWHFASPFFITDTDQNWAVAPLTNPSCHLIAMLTFAKLLQQESKKKAETELAHPRVYWALESSHTELCNVTSIPELLDTIYQDSHIQPDSQVLGELHESFFTTVK